MSKKTGKSQNPQPQTKVKITHHSNGKAESKTAYINGKKHGVETEWFTDGSKWFERMWVSGKRHGDTTYWYNNAGKRWEEWWRADKLHGVATWWDENGRKESETYYLRGQVLSELVWDEIGNVSAVTFSSQIESSNNKTKPRPKSKNTPTVNKK